MNGWKRFFIKVFSWLVCWVPRRVVYLVSCGLGTLLWRVFRFRRYTILKNLRRVFPNRTSSEINVLAEQSLKWFLFHFFEIFRIPAQSARTLAREAIFEGIENVDQALAEKKGILLLSLHLGAGDRAIAMMGQRGYQMSVITKRFRSWVANSLWFSLRGFQGTKYIEAHDQRNAFHILKALKKNEVVIFVQDQFMGLPYGIEVAFFGKPTGAAVGLAIFAQKTKAPVVPMWTYSDVSLRTHVCAGPAISVENGEGEEGQKKLTLIFNQTLEKIIEEHPEHWMWFHRRWKKWE